MITIKQSEGSKKQFCLTYFPDLAKWDDEYISLSGYCGVYGPHVFAAAPELLEALEDLLETCEYGDHNANEYTAAANVIAKSQPNAL